MRIADILVEKQIDSSWIHDISYDGKNAILTVKSGRRYIIKNMPKNVCQNWIRSKSRGAYWNRRLRNIYKSVRIA